ncbi:MAG: hypothetical protein U5K69_25905 [Balneolaceae bacterium]|nr:hypothetical protein [Balneolaceae bacterium]
MRFFTCILLAMLYCLAVPESGFTQDRDNETDAKKYTLIFRGEPIEQAIKELVDSTKIDLIYDANLLNATTNIQHLHQQVPGQKFYRICWREPTWISCYSPPAHLC